MSAVTEDWKAQARELRESGLSEREVAESVGKAASTVHAFFKREGIEPRADGDAEPEASESETQAEPEAPSANGNGHLSPYHAERSRIEDLHNNVGEGEGPGTSMGIDDAVHAGQQGRIGDDGVEWESESAYTEHLRIDGTTQIALDLGGKRATSAVLKLRGRSIEVDGSLRKGDRLKATIEIVVRDARVSDKVDKPTGIVMEAIDKFEADIADLKVIPS